MNYRSQTFIILALSFVALTSLLLDRGLHVFAIVPRNQEYLINIILAPLVHVSWSHWFNNMIVFLPCSMISLYIYKSHFYQSLTVVYFSSGLLVWVLGTDGFHVGISGVAIGLCYYLVVMGLLSFEWKNTLLSLMLTSIHLSLFTNLISPLGSNISNDYHLAGALVGGITGIFTAYKVSEMKRFKY